MTIDTGASFRIRASVEGQAQLDKFNQALRDGGRAGEVSAGQIKAAYRQLPAQFTDIATSLAGGQSPFLVLLQQGGQIRDSFGGIGNAVRAVAGSISGTTLAFGGLAAAAGAVIAAFVQGEAEASALSRALATTGNFAGTTADRFNQAAERIRESSGVTAGSARDLLQAIVQTGQFGPGSYEAVAQAAAQVSRVTGQASADVVKQFQGLSKSAADWAAEQNKTYNFLDVAQYRYIRSLEEAGDREGAQRVSAELLTKALKDREVQLGTLERSWKAVKGAASRAWDAMLNIGRPDTAGYQLADAEKRLQRLQRLRDAQELYGPDSATFYKPRIEAAQAEVEAIRETIRLQGRSADRQAEIARTNQEAIAAERKAEEERKRSTGEKLTEFQQLQRSLEDQRLRVQELNTEETLLAEIQAGRYKTLTGPERERLVAIAREIDSTKALKEASDAAAREKKQADDRAKREGEAEAKRLESARQGYIDLIDPVNRYVRKLQEIDKLEGIPGGLTKEQATEARFRIQEQIDDLNKVKETGKSAFEELKDAVSGWGKEATNTFVEFAFGAKASFGDLVNSILKDLARMLIQKNVTDPLFGALSSAAQPFIRSLFPFANGGIMTSAGPAPLRQYASGGIANSPQLALYGEGSKPEAYVPLPDGRTIPVTMTGGGGGDTYNITVPITLTGEQGGGMSDGTQASALGKVIAGAVRAELINQKRPGGLLAA